MDSDILKDRNTTSIIVFGLIQEFINGQSTGGSEQKIGNMALSMPWLRNELYCQLMKQLTGNHGDPQRGLCWRLMGMCLKAFPPSGKEMEQGLEGFLGLYDAKSYIDDLHQHLFGDSAGSTELSLPDAEIIHSTQPPPPTSFEKQIYVKAEMLKNRHCL